MQIVVAEHPHGHLGAAGQDRLKQPGEVLGGQAAQIGIEQEDHVTAGGLDAGKDGAAFAEVFVQSQHAIGPRFRSDAWSLVRGPV